LVDILYLKISSSLQYGIMLDEAKSVENYSSQSHIIFLAPALGKEMMQIRLQVALRRF
jgi:hypothetical protein